MPYLERLRVPWWMWGLTLGVAVLLAAQVGLGAAGARTWLPFALVLPLVAAATWWLGRVKVMVLDGELWVDDAHLPVEFIADVIPLDQDDRRLLLGSGADPLAFIVQRPWIKGTVQIVLNDPDDPTPYWVISTRSPERLTQAIHSAISERAAGSESRAGSESAARQAGDRTVRS